ncbi:hypothetical protein [Paraburkholderia fungorum]|uniref:hypothetical protein n=1 Tax=Paraburkholderia fungorum TaxID=134537 RepID=UPI00160AB209|nr:hypothetical protein [Paraburkholderia fungorum]MBB5546611.1 hypothetical protein [Paraburkholderia fungorum]
MITSVRFYHEYHTALADAVLPGDDHFARERRAALSEMLTCMLRDGVAMNLYTVGDRLSTFVPLQVRESTGDWKERNLKRWSEQTRPEIFKALGDYFIEGGHEARVEQQKTLLDALEAVGIRIEGRNVLEAVLPWSGDWRKRFLSYSLLGRPEGVLFYGSLDDPVLVSHVRQALREADFARDQITNFFCGLRSMDVPGIHLGTKAFGADTILSRFLRRIRGKRNDRQFTAGASGPPLLDVSGPVVKVWLRNFVAKGRQKDE